MSEEEDLRRQARHDGLIAGAVYRGDVWPVGTLVRMAGRKSKTTYRITGIRANTEGYTDPGLPPLEFSVQLTPVNGIGPGRSIFWTNCEYLREVSE